MKKKLLIRNGNISIGGQEKMLIEFLNVLDKEKYDILLAIEENNGYRNDYINEIPKDINLKFLVDEDFMMKIEKNKNSKNPIRKLYYSYLLKKKKKISIKNFKKLIDFSDIIIDYDMGLLRNLNELKIDNKILIGWSHAGAGEKIKNKKKAQNIESYDYIIAINEKMKNGHMKNTNHPKVEKIYNFMDFENIIEKSNEKIDINYEYIISIGSLTKNKNQELLIKTFAKLKRDKNIKEKLLILGSGKEEENYKRLVSILDMEEDIIFMGNIKNPYKYLKRAKIYLSTSFEESFSLTTLESLVLNKMVIATHTNGTDEILDNSKYGKLIENDEKELYENLYLYLNDEKLRKDYEEKAKLRINDFSKDKIKKEIDEFLEKL